MSGLGQCVAVAFSATLFAPLSPASADEAVPETGLWRGPWYLGMTSGVAELKLTADGGALMLTNNENFGAEAVRISDLERIPGQLRFRASGADGKTLACQIPVFSDGTKARGFCRYGGFNLRFEFSRIGSSTDGH
jgi:hypothetical protein